MIKYPTSPLASTHFKHYLAQAAHHFSSTHIATHHRHILYLDDTLTPYPKHTPQSDHHHITTAHPQWLPEIHDNHFDAIIIQHHTKIENIQATLQECYKIAKSTTSLILIRHNPQRHHSFWQKNTSPDDSITAASMRTALQATHWQIEHAQFMAYYPPTIIRLFSHHLYQANSHIELAGNRWWPHRAALYGIIARKCLLD